MANEIAGKTAQLRHTPSDLGSAMHSVELSPTDDLLEGHSAYTADSVPTMVGTVLDKDFEIISVIGKGGMSLVYKANHLLLKKMVAVKTLLPHLILHPTSLERFRQEAQAASNLNHPNIISIHHFGFTSQGQPYPRDGLHRRYFAGRIDQT